MTVVSRPEFRPRLVALLQFIRTACVGLGYSALVFAAGLALWGWLIANQSEFKGRWDQFNRIHEYAWRDTFPARPAVSVVCIAVALIAIAAYAWTRGRQSSRRIVWLGPRVLAGCAVLYFAAFSIGLAPFYRLVMGNYPVTLAVPMVVAAWLLGLGGAVALLVATPLLNLTRKAMPVVVGGVAVGIAGAVLLTVQAVRAGDDGRYVDATVAPTVDAPAKPAIFGQRRFSLKVSAWGGIPQNRPDVQVAAAGAGFVVFHSGQITGYGSDGKERWHYRRTGPGRVSVTGVRVFDEGRTVVAAVAVGPTYSAQVLVGLDAVTGQRLWSARSPLRSPESDSFDPLRNVHGVEDLEPGPFLIANRNSNTSAWTRFDTRTGKPLWTIDAPVGPHCDGKVADTQSRIVTATVCSANNKLEVGVVVLDPGSGRRLWQTTLAKDIPNPVGNRYELVVTPAGLDGVALFYGSPGRSTSQIYVDVVSHQMRDLGPHDNVDASFERGDRFVVEHHGQPPSIELSLYDSQGLRRCALSPGLKLRRSLFGSYNLYLPLANGVVVYNSNGYTFQTVDNDSCAIRATQKASPAADWLAAAPGVVLVERIETNGTYVDGFD
jgi:outer membrane protein assembly factor BamB